MTLELTTVVLTAIVALFLLRRQFYLIFLVSLLTTEFYHIQIGGGVARPYHFVALLVVFLLISYVPNLISSRIIIALLVFCGINVIAVILSDEPFSAGASLLAFFANIAVCMATALILVSGKVSLATLKKTLIALTLLSIFWGWVQSLFHSFAGIDLALSAEQAMQLHHGLASSLKTEANTFGKFLLLPILLFLPEYLEHRTIRNINLVYLVFFTGVGITFTRSAIYGIAAAMIFTFAWYLYNNKSVYIVRKWPVIIVSVTFILIIIASGILNISNYNLFKFKNLFNQEEVLSGESSTYRMEMMRLVVVNTLSDTKKTIIGNGWGQTHVYFNDEKIQAGGGDWANVFGFGGGLGVAGYLLYSLMALYAVLRSALRSRNEAVSHMAEGCLIALVGMFVTGQISGYLIAPEYWMLLGICVYLSIENADMLPEKA